MKIYDFNGKKNLSGDRIREARIGLCLSQVEDGLRGKHASGTIDPELAVVSLYNAPDHGEPQAVALPPSCGSGRPARPARLSVS